MAVTITTRNEARETDALGEIGSAGFAVEAKNYPPGRTDPHHHDYDVCLHIMQGELRLTLPDEDLVRSCRPGDRVFVPAGTVHFEEHGSLRMVVGRRTPQPAPASGEVG